MKIENFKTVYPFKGYVTETVSCQPQELQIKLRWDKRRKLCCPECGGKMAKNRESQLTAYDLPCGASQVVRVRFPSIQGYCSSCKSYATIRPEEIHPKRKATWRLMRYISMLARYVPLDAMVMINSVPASSAWRYDKDVLEADLPEPNLDGIEAILIDEKSVRRGHKYVTLVLNAETGELLHMSEGKKKASLCSDALRDRQSIQFHPQILSVSYAFAKASPLPPLRLTLLTRFAR